MDRPRVIVLFKEGKLNRVVTDLHSPHDVLIADEPRGSLFNVSSVQWCPLHIEPELVDHLYRLAKP
jgi:hypothetical protein